MDEFNCISQRFKLMTLQLSPLVMAFMVIVFAPVNTSDLGHLKQPQLLNGHNLNGGATGSNGIHEESELLSCFTCSTFDDPVYCKSMLNLTITDSDKLSVINRTNNYLPDTIGAMNGLKGQAINTISIGVDSIVANVNDSLIKGKSFNSLRDMSTNPSSSESKINSQISTASPVPDSRVPFKQCSQEEKFCSVTRIEYVASEVKKKKFWAVERGCSSNCRQGCIILGEGERTKLHFCQSCCTSRLCNFNNYSSKLQISTLIEAAAASLLIVNQLLSF